MEMFRNCGTEGCAGFPPSTVVAWSNLSNADNLGSKCSFMGDSFTLVVDINGNQYIYIYTCIYTVAHYCYHEE